MLAFYVTRPPPLSYISIYPRCPSHIAGASKRDVPNCTRAQVQKEEYGFDPDGVQHFNGDNFNEMAPSSTDPAYLAAWGDAMYQLCFQNIQTEFLQHLELTVIYHIQRKYFCFQKSPEILFIAWSRYAPLLEGAGSGASWFVQGWSLGHWPDEHLSAYWSKVPAGKLLNLDLNCAMSGGSFTKYPPLRLTILSVVSHDHNRKIPHWNFTYKHVRFYIARIKACMHNEVKELRWTYDRRVGTLIRSARSERPSAGCWRTWAGGAPSRAGSAP